MAEITIDDLIIEEFTQQTENYLRSLSLVDLFQSLKLIKNHLNQNVTIHSSIAIKNIYPYNPDLEQTILKTEKNLLFEAYEIIQLIRFKLTSQMLSYRLFVTTDGKDGVPATAKYINISSAAELYSFLGLNSKEIDIVQSRVSAKIKENESVQPDKYATWFNEKYSVVLSHFKHPDTGVAPKSFYVLKMPTALPSPPHARLKTNGSHVVYTRGHIVEALDATYQKGYSAMLEPDQAPESQFISLFGENLGYDSVSGFKGGDVGMVQIKANSARLMRYSSIFNAINKALVIYNLIANQGQEKTAREMIQKKIRALYEDSKGKNEISKITDDTIDKFVDQIISELDKTIKK